MRWMEAHSPKIEELDIESDSESWLVRCPALDPNLRPKWFRLRLWTRHSRELAENPRPTGWRISNNNCNGSVATNLWAVPLHHSRWIIVTYSGNEWIQYFDIKHATRRVRLRHEHVANVWVVVLIQIAHVCFLVWNTSKHRCDNSPNYKTKLMASLFLRSSVMRGTRSPRSASPHAVGMVLMFRVHNTASLSTRETSELELNPVEVAERITQTEQCSTSTARKNARFNGEPCATIQAVAVLSRDLQLQMQVTFCLTEIKNDSIRKTVLLSHNKIVVIVHEWRSTVQPSLLLSVCSTWSRRRLHDRKRFAH